METTKSVLILLLCGLAAGGLSACSDGPSSSTVEETVTEHLRSGDAPAWACGVIVRTGEYELDFEDVDVQTIGPLDPKAADWPVRLRLRGTCVPALFLVGQQKEEARTAFDHVLDVRLAQDASGEWKVR